MTTPNRDVFDLRGTPRAGRESGGRGPAQEHARLIAHVQGVFGDGYGVRRSLDGSYSVIGPGGFRQPLGHATKEDEWRARADELAQEIQRAKTPPAERVVYVRRPTLEELQNQQRRLEVAIAYADARARLEAIEAMRESAARRRRP